MSQTEHRYADFFGNKRASNLFTTVVNERIGAFFALHAYRAGLAPTVLTLINLVIWLGTGLAVILVADSAADGKVTWWPIALAAAAAWQIAYSLDCSDGQLARTTGQSSPMGGRVDILCDVASQTTFCASIAAVSAAYSPEVPAWFIAAFASLWMVNL
ncbi:MAG: CDP-alcohol phosphatidyltransferase family protein, partial [Stackebrandtia sp.]